MTSRHSHYEHLWSQLQTSLLVRRTSMSVTAHVIVDIVILTDSNFDECKDRERVNLLKLC